MGHTQENDGDESKETGQKINTDTVSLQQGKMKRRSKMKEKETIKC